MNVIDRLKERFKSGDINEAYVDKLIGKIITAEEAEEIKGDAVCQQEQL